MIYRGYDISIFPHVAGGFTWTVQNAEWTHSANGTAPTQSAAEEAAMEVIDRVKRRKVEERRTADHVDGFDRDDLGESPDF